MVIISGEDQEWLTSWFVPRATLFGFNQIAIVRPQSYFNRVAVETVVEKIGPSAVKAGFFDHDFDAIRWLTATSQNNN